MQTPIATGGSLLEKLDLSPEERLLITCARLRLSQGQQEELGNLVAGPMDWDQVLHKSGWHNLTPLVFHHLKRLGGTRSVPTEVMHRLKVTYLRNVAHTMSLRYELQRLVDAIQAQGVPIILLKGAALSGTVYGDMGLRPMSDLDLLVPEEQAYIAQQISQDLGYRPGGTQEEQEDTERYHRHLPILFREGRPDLVEVHRHIVRRDSGLYFDLGGFWSRARPISVGKIQALELAPEDLLIHLSLNFFLDRRFHSNVALRQLCDVAETLRHYQSDFRWQLFLENVREYGLSGPLACALYLARNLLDGPVPQEVGNDLWTDGLDDAQMRRFVRRRVLNSETWMAHALVKPGQRYTTGRVIAGVLRRLFPSRRGLAQRYQLPESEVRGVWERLMLRVRATGIPFRSLVRPGELREDLAIDRWHHSMYGHKK